MNDKKCHQIHVGNPEIKCPTLKAHQKDILKVKKDKYLGDTVSYDGKNENNMKVKAASGIMNIIREICLGKFYFPTAFLLRQTIFLSTILLNSETWVNLTVSNVEELEKIDRILLKRIFEAPATTSTKS